VKQALGRCLVSIIMPAYNAAPTLRESVESVLSQTYHEWELIIIDDASTDTTMEIAKVFGENDSRLRVFTNEENKGVAASRNLGIQHASGDFIAFLDSDDIWREDKLAKQLRFMEETSAVISYTATAYLYEESRSNFILQAKRELNYKNLLRKNLMSCSSVMVRREHMRLFPIGYMHEDYALWLDTVKKHGIAYGLNEPLLLYRIGSKSKSAKRVNSAKMLFNSYRQVGYGRFFSAFFTLRYAFHSIAKRAKIKFQKSNG